MRDQTEFKAWPKDAYRNPAGWGRLERLIREVVIAEWKFFIAWVYLYGYEDAVARMEKGDSK